MRILLTGRDGQVGSELAALLPGIGETVSTGRASLDLRDARAIRDIVRSVRPNVIVNAAAYNEVDRAETEGALAHAVNGAAPGLLAAEAKRLDALLVHYSTDYVFDGTKAGAYVESDPTNPVNEYGRSKLAGERAVAESGAAALVLRVAWVYDGTRRNFVTTMLRLAAERGDLRVVGDQVGCPTWARSIARATAAMVRDLERAKAARGIYHLAPPDHVDRYAFVERLLALTAAERAREPRLARITTAEYPLPAPRPLNSVLDASRLRSSFGIELDGWAAQLEACLATRRPGPA